MSQLAWLQPAEFPVFPNPDLALDEPQGLLAVGGRLSLPWLLSAYQQGIFPWYSEGEPIMWWAPTPRMVLQPGTAHISRSLRKLYRKNSIEITVNRHFAEVIRHCGNEDMRADGTWITDEMMAAYIELHQAGWAHSVEVIQHGTLVGGLYGVGIERVFFGESMFSLTSGASKFALIALDAWARDNLDMVDCQLHNPYLESMGATLVPKGEFRNVLPKQRTKLSLSMSSDLNSLLQQQMV